MSSKEVFNEILKRTGWKNTKLYYNLKKLNLNTKELTEDDIDTVINFREKPGFEAWIKETHPECDLPINTIRHRLAYYIKVRLTQVPLEQYEDLYQQVLNTNTQLYESYGDNKTSNFKSQGLYRYLWWKDLLPLSKALERGIYNEDGSLNVFIDPNQDKESRVPLTKSEYFEYGTKERKARVDEVFLGKHDYSEDKPLQYYVDTHEDAYPSKRKQKTEIKAQENEYED